MDKQQQRKAFLQPYLIICISRVSFSLYKNNETEKKMLFTHSVVRPYTRWGVAYWPTQRSRIRRTRKPTPVASLVAGDDWRARTVILLWPAGFTINVKAFEVQQSVKLFALHRKHILPLLNKYKVLRKHATQHASFCQQWSIKYANSSFHCLSYW